MSPVGKPSAKALMPEVRRMPGLCQGDRFTELLHIPVRQHLIGGPAMDIKDLSSKSRRDLE